MKTFRFFFMILGGWTFGSALLAEPASHPALVADSKAWSVRTYRLPALEVSWPSLPPEGAGVGQMEMFFKRSHELAKQYLSTQGLIVLPEGSLAAYDPENQTLAVRTNGATHEIIASLVEMERHVFPHYISLTVHVVEADGDLVRVIVKEAGQQRGRGELWQRMQTLLQSGKAREVSLLHLDTRSAQRAQLRRGSQRKVDDEFVLDEQGLITMQKWDRDFGDHLEVDPFNGLNEGIIDLGISLEHHYAPPTDRWVSLGQIGARRMGTQITDFHNARIATEFTMADGDTHLLGVWKPDFIPELERANVLQAAFVTAADVLVLPSLGERVAELLKVNGEKSLAVPQADAAPRNPPVEGMITRYFRLQPILNVGGPQPQLRPAQEVLESNGVSFPKGALATFNPATSILAVHNTPENLELVRKFTDNILMTIPQGIDFTVHVVQSDAKTLRELVEQTRAQGDHAAAWKSIEEAVAQGRAKILSTSWVPTRSGQRAHLYAGTDYVTPRPPEISRDVPSEKDAKESTKPGPQKLGCALFGKQLGIDLEVDPVIGPDLETLDISVQLTSHYAPPTVSENALPAANDKVLRPTVPTVEFHQWSVNSTFTLTSGMMRLLGVWKPEGTPEFEKGDVLQAAFVKVDVVPVGK